MMKTKFWKYFLFIFAFSLLARWGYKYTPYRVEFLGHYDKVWAHRVNSTEKLSSALSYFDGIELDLVYLPERQKLDVNHPPANSISLDFETYLESIPKEKQPYIWLDIKNLTKEHSQAIWSRLELLRVKMNVEKKHFLIESRYPEALINFMDTGYTTSYYLPSDLNKIDREILNTYPSLGISANYLLYESLSEEFPERKKYLWKIDGLSFSSYKKTRKILKDSSVIVVLSKFRSLRGNR